MKVSQILLFLTLPITVVSIILMCIAFGAYDPVISDYFPRGTVFPALAIGVACLAFGVGVSGVIVSKKMHFPLYLPKTPSFAPIPAALGSLASAVFLFISGKPIIGVLFLLAAGFFALTVAPFAKEKAALITWVGFASVIACIALNATYYFDMTVEMNAPVKVLLQIGLLAAMLGCTAEIRILIGRSHFVLTPVLPLLAMIACLFSAFPVFALAAESKTPTMVYTAAVPFLLGFGTTAGCRLMQITFPQSFDATELQTDEKDMGEQNK
ncbi:MAG: hypothetical protein II955_02325 [Clostridia bacterium]|nr:hypothetical protein [Clostridia bacterium]